MSARGRRVVFPERGRVEVEQFDLPSVGPGQVRIRTEVSLISAGTELTTLLGGHGTDGLGAVSYPAYPGYSNVGIIEAIGAGVSEHRLGDRVLTMGQHASHCLVDLSPERPGGPQYLQPVPDGISPEDASFAVLGSVAMHGLRKAEPQLRESAIVIGQGVVGQLIAQLARVGGCAPVIGVDLFPRRLEMARQSGTPVTVNAADQDVDAAVREATGGAGVDIGFDATRSAETLPLLMRLAALSGRIVVVGSIPGAATISLFDPLQTKELTIIGAWQPRSPLTGHAYFPWTQARNRLAFLELVRDGAVRVDHLITHRVAPEDAPAVYAMVQAGGSDWLGILYRW